MSTHGNTQRELVFCHSCENEWYRDEHGLECPQCHSDVVEIIEESHDPRVPEPAEELGGHLPWLRMQPPGPAHGHGREEEDGLVYGLPPGATLFRTSYGTQQDAESPLRNRAQANPNANVHDLFSGMFQQIGGMTPHEAIRQSQQRNLGSSQFGRPPPPPPVPRDTRPDLSQQNEEHGGVPGVSQRSFRWGPFSVQTSTFSNSQTWVNGRPVQSATSSGPAAAGSPNAAFGARQAPFAHDPDMMGIFGNIFRIANEGQATPGGHHGSQRFVFTVGGRPGVAVRGGEAGGGSGSVADAAQALLASMGLMPHNGQTGDYAFNDDDFHRILSQFMNQNQSNGPEPASEQAIDALPRIKVTKEMTGEDSKTAECGICLADCELDEEVAELPCKHWFHFDCVEHWLKQHDTCPSCRRGIMPHDTEQNRVRNTGEAPRVWQMPNLSRSNTHESQGEEAEATASRPRTGSAPTTPREAGPSTSSRSPGSPGQGQAGQRGSVIESIGNNILGWMGRHLSVSSPTHGSAPSRQTTSSDSAATGATTSSSRSVETESRRRRDSHAGLDNPEID